MHPVQTKIRLGISNQGETTMFRTFTALCLLAFSTTAVAEGPNWTFIQGDWLQIEIDDPSGDADGDGFGIGGSFEVGDSFHILASYGSADLDFGIDFDQFTIGGGWHTGLTENTDFFANLAYTRLEASALGVSVDDDGFAAQIGVRGMASPSVELSAAITQTELDDSGGDTSFSAGGWYHFNDSFAVGLEAETGDDVTVWGLGFRAYFGN